MGISLILLGSVVSNVFADDTGAECRPNPHLPRAAAEYDRLEFDRAARSLRRAMEHSRNCREDLAEIYRLQAFVDAVHGERARCRRAFEILLALRPDYSMGADVPPKIRKCFEDALRISPSERDVRLVHRPPESVRPRNPVEIEVAVRDPLRLVDRVQVWFRRRGVNVFTVVTTRSRDRVLPRIPALAVPEEDDAYAIEYFIRAVDRFEGTLFEVAGPDRPLVVRVEAAASQRPLYARWWFWTAIGVAAAGAGGAAWAVAEADRDEVRLDVETTVESAP